ncbi:unnamed protein product [Blepharisma stoltei]|uniref:Uncharacterized protein n=1 Tax=Blepharisma stoltei TaxID=1481888 RepID=A0AAU9JT99_9CILI|nr:unnamed protein product [Blepharisma stoltei]
MKQSLDLVFSGLDLHREKRWVQRWKGKSSSVCRQCLDHSDILALNWELCPRIWIFSLAESWPEIIFLGFFADNLRSTQALCCRIHSLPLNTGADKPRRTKT